MSKVTMSNNILPLCAVIRINGIFPKSIRVTERKQEPDTQFLLLAKTGEKFLFYLNLKSELSEGEIRKFTDFWTNANSERILSVKHNIVEMEVPDQIQTFLEEMGKIPLARVAPNVLRNGTDMYINLEFCEYSRKNVSKVVLEILDADFPNSRSLEYFGESREDIPDLLHKYSVLGLPLRDFTTVTTVWECGDVAVSSVYSGFFLNDGDYVPKTLSTDSHDVLIVKHGNKEIKGDLVIRCQDEESGLAEVELKSGYLSDLLNEIIKSYSGPLFYAGKTIHGKSLRYYILDTDLTSVFIKALSEFWNMRDRKNFKNYIYRIENLEDTMNTT